MRTEALSHGYSARSLLGRHYLEHLRALLRSRISSMRGFISTQDALTAGIVQRLGFAWRPRLLARIYARHGVPRDPRRSCRRGEVSRWRKLEPNYIAALLGADAASSALVARSRPTAPACCRRCCVTRCCSSTRTRPPRLPARRAGASVAALLRDQELVDLVTGAPPTETWKRQLDLIVPAVTGDQDDPRVSSRASPPSRRQPSRRWARSARASRISGTRQRGAPVPDAGHARPRVAPARRMGHLVCDQAARGMRARARRASTSAATGGSRTSSRRPRRPARADRAAPPGEQGPLVAQPNDSGFIHAPSMTHAATAALLRNAHLGRDAACRSRPARLPSTCRRAACARRSGCSTASARASRSAALLGYRFERRLHELGTGRSSFMPFREIAPLARRQAAAVRSLPLENIAANNVVDGLVLHQKWRDDEGAS